MTFHGTQFFHVGIVVADLDAAIEQVGGATDLTFGRAMPRSFGAWSYRIVFSRQGPPHVELIEATPGSPWETGPGGATRIDHLQWWSSDLAADAERLLADGAALDLDGLAYEHPFGYFRLAGGLRVELIEDRDGSRRATYRTRWQID